ncbi:uncharacterized protein LOC144940669 isoform X1 [Lampetra fluviatilis]
MRALLLALLLAALAVATPATSQPQAEASLSPYTMDDVIYLDTQGGASGLGSDDEVGDDDDDAEADYGSGSGSGLVSLEDVLRYSSQDKVRYPATLPSEQLATTVRYQDTHAEPRAQPGRVFVQLQAEPPVGTLGPVSEAPATEEEEAAAVATTARTSPPPPPPPPQPPARGNAADSEETEGEDDDNEDYDEETVTSTPTPPNRPVPPGPREQPAEVGPSATSAAATTVSSPDDNRIPEGRGIGRAGDEVGDIGDDGGNEVGDGDEVDTNEVGTPRTGRPRPEEPVNNEVSARKTTAESLLERTEVLAAVVAGGVVGLLFAAFLVLLLIYRMKKKDEGSYALADTKEPVFQPPPAKEFYA